MKKHAKILSLLAAGFLFSSVIGGFILLSVSVSAREVATGLDYQHDGDKTAIATFNDTRANRFCEIFFIKAKGEQMELHVYNPTGLNNMETTHNSCPDEMLEKVDFEGLKTHYQMDVVYLNKPRFWLADHMKIPIGAVRDFNGMEFYWMAASHMSKDVKFKPGFLTWKKAPVERKTEITYVKGKPVFLLDDPEGKVWVMKAFRDSHGQTYETLKDLGSRYKLIPEGWKFRVKILEKDLITRPVEGAATVIQDDFENTFDYLGDGSSNYVP